MNSFHIGRDPQTLSLAHALTLTIVLSLCISLNPHAAQGAERQQHTVMADGHPLVVWEKSPTNPIGQILLLHGRTWSSLPDFDLQVEGEDLSFMDGLNALGYRVYALDARGYGDTQRDESGWLTPDRATRDAATVVDWIKAQHDDDLHLYGWSYGSMVAQLVVQRAPQSVSSVTLFGYPFDPSRHITDAAMAYPTTPPAKPNTASNAASDFIVPGAISQKAINAYVDAALQADPIRVDFKNYHEWAELDPRLITTPTLLLQGEFDPLAATPRQAELFTQIPQANKWWVVLAGGDHAALLETPRQQMLQAMDSFIRALPAVTTCCDTTQGS
ncbi:MAG: pimeloyl-ACP methyl ester carboxylesterase [Cyclobacteriaceae bacterium]|jgi:pimeloyl-ACP methyl ester carboxylesterase